MSRDSLSPIAPARVRALVLPLGPIKRDRFNSFVDRLQDEHVVQLRDITADARPNRSVSSPPSATIRGRSTSRLPPEPLT